LPAKRLRAELALAGVTAIWGVTFVLVKSALEDISPALFLAARFALASLLLAVMFRRELAGGLLGQAGSLKAGLSAGIFLALAYLLQTVGLQYTSASKSAFLTSLCVVMVPLLGLAVYRNVPAAMEAVAVCMAMLGMYWLTAPETGGGWNRGDMLTAVAAAAFASHVLVLERYAPKLGFTAISLLQVLVAAGCFAASFWWLETPRVEWTGRVLWTLAVTAALCTALAFTVQAWAQQHTSASRTALIFALEPISAAATSYVVLGERLSGRAAMGAALILAAVLAVEWKPERIRKHLFHRGPV